MSNNFRNYIPYGRHQILESDIEEVLEVLRYKNLTQGDITEKFEDEKMGFDPHNRHLLIHHHFL